MADDAPVGRLRRIELPLALALVAGVTVVAAAAVPTNDNIFIDQLGFRDVHARMRDGGDYYRAFRDAYLALDIRLGELRAYRQPYLFVLWRLVPYDVLQALFFVVCVLGTGVAAAFVGRRPVLAVGSALWVAVAGHHLNADGWLVSEVWAAPLVTASCAAWLRGRHGAAAAAATGAFLVRETTAPLLLGLALWRWRRGGDVRPYAVGIATSVVGFAVHAALAVGRLDPPGTEADTIGTGGFVAVASMVSYGGLLVPRLVGLVLWAIGVVRLWRSPLRPAVGLALLPLSALVIGRIYWGLSFMPLLVAVLLGVAEERAPAPPGDGLNDRPSPRRAPSRAQPPPPRPVATSAP